MVDNLHWALEEGAMMYEHRAEAPGQEATMWIENIGELCKQIEEQLNATYLHQERKESCYKVTIL